MNLKHLAKQAGFDLVGAVPVGATPHWEQYRKWIENGYFAGMSYLARPDAQQKRQAVSRKWL